jgi:hypothetical protein
VVGIVLALGAAVGAALLIPALDEVRTDNAERERREAAEARARQQRALIAESRPHHGRAPAGRSLERSLAAAIVVDANARVRRGELDTRVRRADCVVLTNDDRGRLFSCVAVTSDIPRGQGSGGGRVGYPYRARADVERGSFSFCKVAGRPGEGLAEGRGAVPLPEACGG